MTPFLFAWLQDFAAYRTRFEGAQCGSVRLSIFLVGLQGACDKARRVLGGVRYCFGSILE
jgi:hypothetical protein